MAKPPVLRERVRFERPASHSDGYGNEERGWSELATVFAQVRPLRGSETVLAGKLEGRRPVEITVRWSPSLAVGDGALRTDDRAVNIGTGETFNVRSIENPDMRRMWLTIIAEAGVA